MNRRRREEELRRIAEESRAEAENRARAANRQRLQTYLESLEKRGLTCHQKNLPLPQRNNPVIKPDKFIKYASRRLDISHIFPVVIGDDGKIYKIRNNENLNSVVKIQNENYNQYIYINNFYQHGWVGSEEPTDKLLDTAYGYNGCGAVAVCEGLAKIAASNSIPIDIKKCAYDFKEHLIANGMSRILGIQPTNLYQATYDFINYGNSQEINLLKNRISLSVYQINEKNRENEEMFFEYLKSWFSDPNASVIVDFTAREEQTVDTQMILNANNGWEFMDLDIDIGTKITHEGQRFAHFSHLRGVNPVDNNFLLGEYLAEVDENSHIMVSVPENQLRLAMYNAEKNAQESANAGTSIKNAKVDDIGFWMLLLKGNVK